MLDDEELQRYIREYAQANNDGDIDKMIKAKEKYEKRKAELYGTQNNQE